MSTRAIVFYHSYIVLHIGIIIGSSMDYILFHQNFANIFRSIKNLQNYIVLNSPALDRIDGRPYRVVFNKCQCEKRLVLSSRKEAIEQTVRCHSYSSYRRSTCMTSRPTLVCLFQATAPPEEKKTRNSNLHLLFGSVVSAAGGARAAAGRAMKKKQLEIETCMQCIAMQLGLAVGPVRVYPSHLAIRFRCAQQRRHADGSDALLEAGAAGSNKSPAAGRPALAAGSW